MKNGISLISMHIISSQGPEIIGHSAIRHSQKQKHKINVMLEYSQYLSILIISEVFKFSNLLQVEQAQVWERMSSRV